uniref:Uncharacterized protein n=1 Tax=Rhizophora mucronata TaxID=61149 RepID=A0A2P2QHN9_RHIMU
MVLSSCMVHIQKAYKT